MGSGSSTGNPYKTLKGSVSGDDKWVTYTDFFGLEEHEHEAFFKMWRKMDNKGLGAINFDDFHKIFTLSENGEDDEEETQIMFRFFGSLDVDSGDDGDEHVLYFQEWAVRTFGFGTLNLEGLVERTFELFDPDKSGHITQDEFMEMIKLCKGPSAVKPGTKQYKKTVRIREFLDQDRSGKLSFAEFKQAEGACAELFSPLLELQRKIQTTILGESWWKTARKVRENKLNFSVISGKKIPWTVYNTGGTYTPWRGGAPPKLSRNLKAQKKKNKANARAEAKGGSENSSRLGKYDDEFEAIAAHAKRKPYYYEREDD